MLWNVIVKREKDGKVFSFDCQEISSYNRLGFKGVMFKHHFGALRKKLAESYQCGLEEFTKEVPRSRTEKTKRGDSSIIIKMLLHESEFEFLSIKQMC